MERIQAERKFILEKGTTKVTLPDPDSALDPTGVLKFYSRTYPELTTSTVVGPAYEGDKIVYTFKTCVGTKG